MSEIWGEDNTEQGKREDTVAFVNRERTPRISTHTPSHKEDEIERAGSTGRSGGKREERRERERRNDKRRECSTERMVREMRQI